MSFYDECPPCRRRSLVAAGRACFDVLAAEGSTPAGRRVAFDVLRSAGTALYRDRLHEDRTEDPR
jgi:hypothetical protein